MTKNDSKEFTVLINKLNSGGAEKVCVLICNELVKREYKVQLCVVGFENNLLSSKLNNNVQITNLKKNSVRSSLLVLAHYLIKRRPKTILIFNTELCILAIILNIFFIKKVKIIFRSINTLSMELTSPKTYWKKFFVYPLIKILLKSTDFIVAQSEGMKEDLINNYKINSERIITIPNPALLLDNNLSDKINISKKNELVFIGRLVPQKGLKLLFEALSIVLNSVNDLHLSILGEGPELDTLKIMAEDLRLTKSISFIGFTADVSSYIIKAKATVLTSYYEGFPNVLVESIALGTPIVSFDCPSGPRDIIETNVNGILVPYLDVKLFAEAIVKILKNDIVFESHKIIASSEKFSLKVVVDEYEKLLLKLSNFS
jgi:glycosyltransferase involved in cell wall biosynthesis